MRALTHYDHSSTLFISDQAQDELIILVATRSDSATVALRTPGPLHGKEWLPPGVNG